jgi:rhomboid protease GluP
MPICPRCGKEFSGFSFGSNPPIECRGCRKAQPQSSTRPGAQLSTEERLLLRTGSFPVVTRTIVAINACVFVAMGASGVSWADPSYQDIVRWGGDFSPLTMSGEWWRLFTSTFVHIGIVHIVLNMWCLWDLGPILERLMGWKAFLVTYAVTGIAASEASLAWTPMGGGAGASGAIFGVAGAFFSFLLLKKAPISAAFAKRLRKSLSAFIFYNLFFGVVALRVNNAAHFGGLVAGLILGAVIPCVLPRTPDTSGESTAAPPIYSLGDSSAGESHAGVLAAVALLSACALVAGAFAIREHDSAIAQYGAAVKLIRGRQASAAIPRLQNAIALDPKRAYPYEMLGILLLDGDDPIGAFAPLDKAVHLDPNNLALRHNLGLAYIAAGYSQYAAEEIGWALQSPHEDRSAAEFILGISAYRDKNYDEASKHLLSAIQNRRDFFQAQDNLARVYIEMDKRDEARSLYAAVLAQHPDAAVAKYGSDLLSGAPKGTIGVEKLPPIIIPYSKLTAKSQYWPLLP